jgi:hypothetical protein
MFFAGEISDFILNKSKRGGTEILKMSGAMDIGVVVAIGVLSAVFIAALVALVVVLKKRYCKPVDLISQQYLDTAYVQCIYLIYCVC